MGCGNHLNLDIALPVHDKNAAEGSITNPQRHFIVYTGFLTANHIQSILEPN